MKHVIIGTAGHVDHGKTCLIKALTGIETDRLKEEKKRGITIELGFAHMDFEDGRRVGIIDVPGHEKFVKNMLAGAGGMDLAMLVVAADEGIMPQTVEHLDILSILGITGGVVVITKKDLVEPEFLELVEEDIRELTAGTFLENAPVIPVSVYDNEGLDELKNALQKMCRALPERGQETGFRLPIDRVFTLKGFGTIVTGTMMEGKVKKDQEVMLYPSGDLVKVRSLQVHSKDAQAAFAGQRTAVNIPGRKKEEINRGDILAAKNSMFPTMMLDVKLELLKHTEHTVKHGSRVHVYHGTKELLGKVALMDRDELKAGESAYAQLRLEEETAAGKGDHFVIRFYSPVETVGGGVILDACPLKHRKNDKKALRAFQIKESGTAEEMLELSVREHWGQFFSLDELARRNSLCRNSLKKDAEKLCQAKKIREIMPGCYIHEEEFIYYRKKLERFLDAYHKENPLKEGAVLEEVRSRMNLSEQVKITDGFLELMKTEKVIKETNGYISKYKFRVVVKEDEDAILQEIQKDYLAAGFAPLATEVYASEHRKYKKFKAIFTSLLNKKVLIRLDDQYCIHHTWYEKAQEAFITLAKEHPVVELGTYREYIGCSRRVAVPLLEYLDKQGFCQKVDGGRVLKNKKKE